MELQALPLYFVGELEPWLEYRAQLIRRCEDWNAGADAGRRALAAGEAERLFPPPAFSPALFAGSQWRPSRGPLRLVLVSVGGVYGGIDGPAGLYEYLAAVADPGLACLQLDGGHEKAVAVEVLRAGLRWLLATVPEAAGLIVLAGFSMGSAAIGEAGAEVADAVRAVLVVAGQTAGTQGLVRLKGKAALLVHGDQDPQVPASCTKSLAGLLGNGPDVQTAVFPQEELPPNPDTLERLQRHHLWDERWDVQALVLDWLRRLARA